MNGTGSRRRQASGRLPHGAGQKRAGGDHVVTAGGGTGPLSRAVTQLDEMVESGRRRHASRQSLRSLVEQTDVVIAACERAHLAGTTTVTDDLVARAEALWAEARSVLAGTAGWRGRLAVDSLASRRVAWIHQLMDALWSLQEATFNELVPWRVQLADNEESERWSERIPA